MINDRRITIILPSLNNRISPVKGALLLADFLYQEGFTISLLSLKGFQDKTQQEKYPFKTESLNITTLFGLLTARRKIIQHLNTTNSEIIFTFTIFPDLLASTIKNIKKVSFIRAYLIDQYKQDFPIFSYFVTKLHTVALTRFRYVIAMTANMRSEIISLGIKPEKVIINKNSIDILATRNSMTDYSFGKASNINIGIVGFLTKRKRVSDAIKAIAKINKPIILNIFGSGPDLSERMNISRQVIFHGYVDSMVKNYMKMDIVLSTSMSEGVSRAMIEAMSLGKTVIASDIPGSLDLIEDGKTGFIFRKGDHNHLAQTIDEVLTKNQFIDAEFLMDYMEKNHDYRICYKALIQRIL